MLKSYTNGIQRKQKRIYLKNVHTTQTRLSDIYEQLGFSDLDFSYIYLVSIIR